MSCRATTSLVVLGLGLLAPNGRGTVLTFDLTPISNFLSIDQNYGDNVTATTMGSFAYGSTQGFTPDVTLTYGNSIPALWTTGYGNLSNILYEDFDVTGVLNLTLTGASGYLAVLHSFELAAFSGAFASDPTINSVRVYDGADTLLFSQTSAAISKTTSTPFSFGTPLQADILRIEINALNLGGLNDDIGIDNVAFSQAAIPEPGICALLLAAGSLFLAARLRRRNVTR